MEQQKFLTAEEVSGRYRAKSVRAHSGTGAMRIGAAFVKIGKAVLYAVDELDAWDEKNLVSCRASRRPAVTEQDWV